MCHRKVHVKTCALCEEVSPCVDYGKQQSIRGHAVIGIVVVKEPSGSLTEHIESSKNTAGVQGGLHGKPAGASSWTKAPLKASR